MIRARTGMGFVALGVAIDSIQNQNLVNNLNLPPTSSNVEKQTNALSHSIAKNKDDDIISVHLPAFGCITTGAYCLDTQLIDITAFKKRY